MNKAELDHVCSRVAAVFEDEFRQRGWLPAQTLEIPGFTIDALRKQAFGMPPADQYRLACLIAENVGYVLVEEPEHPDSPHVRENPSASWAKAATATASQTPDAFVDAVRETAALPPSHGDTP